MKYCSIAHVMMYWYSSTARGNTKIRGFERSSSPRGEGVLKGYLRTELLLHMCKYMCIIQFVWRDLGYVHAGTIRTWIMIPDMVKDVLDMVN